MGIVNLSRAILFIMLSFEVVLSQTDSQPPSNVLDCFNIHQKDGLTTNSELKELTSSALIFRVSERFRMLHFPITGISRGTFLYTFLYL